MLIDTPPAFVGLAVTIFCLTIIMAIYGIVWMVKRLLMKCGLLKNDKDSTEGDNVGPKD